MTALYRKESTVKRIHPPKALQFLVCTIAVILFCIAVLCKLYHRSPLELCSDPAYQTALQSEQGETWLHEVLATGHSYYLYLPEALRDCKEPDVKIPLIVAFHGSQGKSGAVRKMGQRFISPEFQERVSPAGAAVLVMQSRIDYFTDPHSMSLLIQNVVLKNKCIDKTNIIAFGFSQGAKFAVELACTEPRLFRAVISGSGFYQISFRELLSVLPVSFYSALSENDKGIFEQGVQTGRLCGMFCRNSRYVQYKERYHFCIELYDKTGRNEETMEDWLLHIINQ